MSIRYSLDPVYQLNAIEVVPNNFDNVSGLQGLKIK